MENERALFVLVKINPSLSSINMRTNIIYKHIRPSGVCCSVSFTTERTGVAKAIIFFHGILCSSFVVTEQFLLFSRCILDKKETKHVTKRLHKLYSCS